MGAQKHDTAPKISEWFALGGQLGVWLLWVHRGEFSKFSKLLQTLGPPSLLVGQARGAFFRPPNCVFRPRLEESVSGTCMHLPKLCLHALHST